MSTETNNLLERIRAAVQQSINDRDGMTVGQLVGALADFERLDQLMSGQEEWPREWGTGNIKPLQELIKGLEKQVDLANREADRAVAEAKKFRERLQETVEQRNNLQLSLTDMRFKRDRAELARDAAQKERDQLREEGLKADAERNRFETACTRLEEEYLQLSERFRIVTRALHHAQRDVRDAQSSSALGKRVQIEADLVDDIRTAVSKRDRLINDAIQEASRG